MSRILLSVAFFVVFGPGSLAQTATITTYAGKGLPVVGEPAIVQGIDSPASVVSDGAGGFYFSSPAQNRIYRVTADGTLDVVAGTGTAGFSGDGGNAQAALLSSPQGIAVDRIGNVFIADAANQRIRRVNAAGFITTVTGSGTRGFSGDGGPAISAQLNYPNAVAVDAAGNLFIADTSNNRIREMTPDGIIRTVGGGGTPEHLGDGGAAVEAWLWNPKGITVDPAGNLFIADADIHRVRKITPEGIISTVAGSGTGSNYDGGGFGGDGGAATSSLLSWPTGVAVDDAGNLYVADLGNHRIRRVTREGKISTVAGVGLAIVDERFIGDDGPATSAQIHFPLSVAVDGTGNLFIADSQNSRVRKVYPDGNIVTVAGAGRFGGEGGPATAAQLWSPRGIAADQSGNLYIADAGNYRVRKISPDGIISTFAGHGSPGFGGDGGTASSAQFYVPLDVVVDRMGNVFIADANRIRKVTPNGFVSTLAGDIGRNGFRGDGGPAASALLSIPTGVAIDGAGNLFIADSENNRIRKITTDNVISTVAGTGRPGFAGDGGPAEASQLDHPHRVEVDSKGNLFIADTGNNRIRKVSADGIITTVAGTGVRDFGGDGGLAVAAHLGAPWGLAVDSEGNLFIADTLNFRIRKVTPAGIITTVAGTGISGFSGDGGDPNSAQFYYPYDVAVDGTGNVFISDTFNHRIRKVTP